MCICKRRCLKSITTHTINKNMPPPPPPPPRHASARDNRGRRSPTATPHAAAHDGAGASRQAPAVSIDQISSILDPFFIDTCQFFKQPSPPPRQQAPAATVGTNTNAAAAADTTAAAAAAAADTTDAAAADQPWRIESAFLSGVEETADEAQSDAEEGDATAGGAVDVCGNVNGARALQNILGAGSSAWMETVRDMEAEKNDMLRLDVRSPN
ncbi:unnamed protein product [Ectocarpus sp. CCAP 1310/34]|nr:unnamed protein product [Ectocarpus sp. CCAP 1310/34]